MYKFILVVVCLWQWYGSYAQFEQKRFPIKELSSGKIGFLNQNGKLVIAPQFVQVVERFLASNRGVVKLLTDEEDKLALIDTNGVILARFSAYYDIDTKPYAIITQKGKTVFIDSKGKTIYDQPFDEIRYSGYHFRVMHDGKYGMIDRQGKTVLPIIYDYIGTFNNGMAIIQQGDVKGYIDEMGKITIPLQFKEARDFSYGSAYVTYPDGKSASIVPVLSDEVMENRKKFEVKKEPINGYYQYDICENGWYRVALKVGDKFEGKTVKSKKVVYYRKDGSQAISQIFDESGFFKNGITYARLNNEYGFIDTLGNWVIKPTYSKAADFKGGLALVAKDDKYGMINRKGEEVIPISYYSFLGLSATGHFIMQSFKNSTGKLYYDSLGNVAFQIPAFSYDGIENHSTLAYNRGIDAYKNKNYTKAYQDFLESAAFGKKDAMAALANMYTMGEGVARDIKQADFWFKEAGNFKSRWLFYLYEKDDIDRQSVFPYLVNNAALNDPIPSYELGKMFHRGIGVEKDSLTASLLLSNALQAGHVLAGAELNSLQKRKAIERLDIESLITALGASENSSELLLKIIQDSASLAQSLKSKHYHPLFYVAQYYFQDDKDIRMNKKISLPSKNVLGITEGMVVNSNGRRAVVTSITAGQYARLSNGMVINLASSYGLSIVSKDDKSFRETCNWCKGGGSINELVKTGSFVTKDVTYKTGSTISGDKKITTYTEKNLYANKPVVCPQCNGSGWRYKH